MENKIYTKDDKLIIEIPLKAKRGNPYDESYSAEMDNIVGLVYGQEIGFAYRIDREYKDKDDDVSSLFYVFEGGEEEFRGLCKKLNIQVFEIHKI
jgi:hypothetical protein